MIEHVARQYHWSAIYDVSLLGKKLLISVAHHFFLESAGIVELALVLKLQQIIYLSASMINYLKHLL